MDRGAGIGRRPSLRGALLAMTCLPALAAAGAALAQEQATTVLEPVTVFGEAASAFGPDKGYVAERTTTGSKTDTPLKEIPQSVSVITRKEMDDRAPAQLEDILSYTAGVTSSPWGVDDRFDQFLIRGFDIGPYAVYRDGLAQKALDFSGFKIEPYSLERLEVLKGPSSVLYGENEVGGMVNAVTKRPTLDPLASAFISYGSFNTIETGFDVGGPVDANGVLSYRLTGLYRDGAMQTDGSQNDRIFIAPAVTFRPDDRTTLTLLANYQSDKLQPNTFLPVGLPRSFTTDSDHFSHYDAQHWSVGYQFEHRFNDEWTVRQNMRYAVQETDYQHLYYGSAYGGDSLVCSGSSLASCTMKRTTFMVDERASIFSVDNQVQYDADWGRIQNKLLMGLGYDRFNVNTLSRYGEGPDLDLGNLDYSKPVTVPGPLVDGEQTIDQLGLYAQTQTKLDDHWILTLGLRQTWVENQNVDRLYNDNTRQSDHALTKRIGLGYTFDNGLTPYASYAESFTTNVGHDFDGGAFKPSRGRQYEVGVKYQPPGFDGFFTAAVFDITKSNVLTTDLSHQGFQVQTGEVRHRGLELEGQFNLAEGLSMTAAYTYLDAEITKDNDGNVGKRPSLVPEHQASLWANYEVQTGMLQGVSVGAGVRYVGATYGDNANNVPVASYTLVDAALRYRWDKWQGAVNVSNLLDKTYYSTCNDSLGSLSCIYGEGRVVKGTLSVKF
ncbi:TonB-dependent siderophore receptor [Labrys wisconsinensis]|uniref:Iron complex outermembrane receptor protein n=1 Tax=Labrys wisconsinensis TaxID=425677 RepID=A0ABU0J0V8_9HYPH|nr:TonB-dependent siderophore receptor [Labrys wisconsinensis]MDQ0467883.1 iron complex outermembrane receptor protein [Labrys wisconsinensis]